MENQWLAEVKGTMCGHGQDRAFIRDLADRQVTVKLCDALRRPFWRFDGTRWNTDWDAANGYTERTPSGKNDIYVAWATDRGKKAGDYAATLYHEGVHTRQPLTWSLYEMECNAWTEEERWRLARKLAPSEPHARNEQGLVDEQALCSRLEDHTSYRGIEAEPGWDAVDQIPANPATGEPAKTLLGKRETGANGKVRWVYRERTAREGDAVYGSFDLSSCRPVDIANLQCP